MYQRNLYNKTNCEIRILQLFSILTIIILLVSHLILLLNIDNENVHILNYDEKLITNINNKSFDNIMPDSNIFYENKGQWDEEILYAASTPFGSIAIGATGIYYNLVEENIDQHTSNDMNNEKMMEQKTPLKGYIIKYCFVESLKYQVIGINPINTSYNFFLGNNQEKWVTNVTAFSSVQIKNIWKGIDIQYYFKSNQIKYDIHLSPWSDYDKIRIKILGQNEIVNNYDELDLRISNKIVFSDRNLFVYYPDQPENKINASFTLIGEDVFSINLRSVDRNRKIIIDPLVYSSFIGGSDDDTGIDVCIGKDQDVYTLGMTTSIDIPTTPGAYDTIMNDSGYNDLMISHIIEDGSKLLHCTYLGGSNFEFGSRIFVTSIGEVLISGTTNSHDFPVCDDSYDCTWGGISDGFIAKLNKNLSKIKSSTYLGGQSLEQTLIIDINEEDEVFAGGRTQSIDFPTTKGTYSETLQDVSGNFFALKMDNDLTSLQYSTFIGGTGTEYITDIVVDGNDQIILGGFCFLNDYPTTSNAYSKVNKGSGDPILTKFNSNFSELIFSTYFGGSDYDTLYDIELSLNNEIVIQGTTFSTDFPLLNESYDSELNEGSVDVYIIVFSSNGSIIKSSTLLGGISYEEAGGISVDSIGNIISIGNTGSRDFPITIDAFQEEYCGGFSDVYVSIFSYELDQLLHSTYIGGSKWDKASSVSIGTHGNIFITGSTDSIDLPLADRSFSGENSGMNDTFLCRYDYIKYTEPLEISSLSLYKDQSYNVPLKSAYIDDPVYIEIKGVDSNESNKDAARINITSVTHTNLWKSILLIETDLNSGIYHGVFNISPIHGFLDYLVISSYMDPSKYSILTIEPPNRPSSIMDLRLFDGPTFENEVTVAEKNETVFIRLIGSDSNSLSKDKALVNISNVNIFGDKPCVKVLVETGINTGIYTGEYKIPKSAIYLDQINFTSARDETKHKSIIVNTHVLISPIVDVTEIGEDINYSVNYSNAGWQPTVYWQFNTDVDWLFFDEHTLELYGRPTNNDVGVATVWLDLSDDFGHTDSHEFKIKILNRVPTIVGENVLEIYQDSDYHVDYFSDDEGDGDTTWSYASNASWLSLEKYTGILSGSPTNADVGHYFVDVKVKDGNDGENSTSFFVEVIDVNDPPEISTTDITRVTQGDPYLRDYDATDIDLGDSIHWSMKTYPYVEWLSINNNTGLLSGIPGPEDVGTCIVNVTAIDSRGLSDSHEFTLIVENINDKPFFTDVPNDIDVYSGKIFEYDVNASDFDISDQLEYTVSTIPKSDISIDSSTGEIFWKSSLSFFDEPPYNLRVEVSVTDGEFTIKHNFKITVLITEPPETELIFPLNGDKSSYQKTMLMWDGFDPDGDRISYDVYIGTTNVYVSSLSKDTLYISDFEYTSLVVSGLDPGMTYYWTVIPFDGGSFGRCNSGVHSFRLNSVPKISPVDFQTAKTGETFRMLVQGSDDDSDDQSGLRYSIEKGPNGMQIDENSGLIRWKPGIGDEGLHQIVVNLSDGIDVVKISFTIEVDKGRDTSGLSLFAILAIPVFIILSVVIILLVSLIRKKRVSDQKDSENDVVEEQVIGTIDDESPPEFKSDVALSPSEAHAHLGKGSKQVSYEELYGIKAPASDDESDIELTTVDLRDEIRKQIENLESMEEE